MVDALAAGEPDPRTLPTDEANEAFRARGVELMFGEIRQSLHDFGVDFDVYFHEDSLHKSGAVDQAVARLRELGHVFEADGAVWLRTTTFGDDRDRVIIRSNGEAAYIAGDIAYYLDKRERGFDRVVIMLGADHHGYIGRMMAICAAFGDEPGVNLEILIGQMVNLVKDGAPVRMSKRAGTVVTIDDLVDAVGVDAARYALARSSADSSIDLDLDLLAARRTRTRSSTCSTRTRARRPSPGTPRQPACVARTGSTPRCSTTRATRCCSASSPSSRGSSRRPPNCASRTGSRATSRSSPGRTTPGTAQVRVTPFGDEEVGDVHRTRLWLNDATRQVLANGLGLLGVGARSGCDGRALVDGGRAVADGVVSVAGVDVRALAATHGTPAYVLDEADLRSRARAYRRAFETAFAEIGAGVDVYYAGKAFLRVAVARWVHEEGLRVDTATGGELAVALRAGIPGAHIGLHGNNKSDAEIARALDAGVGRIIVDSLRRDRPGRRRRLRARAPRPSWSA